jgi:hypothetical protein
MEGKENAIEERKRRRKGEDERENAIIQGVIQYHNDKPARKNRVMTQDLENVRVRLEKGGLETTAEEIKDIWTRYKDRKRHGRMNKRRKEEREEKEKTEREKLEEMERSTMEMEETMMREKAKWAAREITKEEREEMERTKRELEKQLKEREFEIKLIEGKSKEYQEQAKEAEENAEAIMRKMIEIERRRKEIEEQKQNVEAEIERTVNKALKEERLLNEHRIMMKETEVQRGMVSAEVHEALKKALGERNLQIKKLLDEKSRTVMAEESNRNEMRGMVREREGSERARANLAKEKADIEARKRMLDEEWNVIRANQAKTAMMICAPALVSIVANLNEEIKRRGGVPPTFWSKHWDALAEDEEVCVGHIDWRLKLTEEEKKKYFTRDERGRIETDYGPSPTEWVRFVRNIWAHKQSKGFQDDLQLYDWALKRWPGHWGVLAKLLGRSEPRLDEGVCQPHMEFLEVRRKEFVEDYRRRKEEEKEAIRKESEGRRH